MAHINFYIENPDGNAVQTSAVLTVSTGPSWVTACRFIRDIFSRRTISITLTATDSCNYGKSIRLTLTGGYYFK